MRFFSAVVAPAVIAGLTFSTTVAQAQENQGQENGQKEHVEKPNFGVARLIPTQGNDVRGTLLLVQREGKLRIVGRVENLEPGKHGFHVHQYGDLRAADGTSAGGHYNPEGHEHGAPGEQSHAGDLGNITANDQGVAEVDMTTEHTKLHFLLGRAFVVHGGKDDLQSQPSGSAGPRVALGVIGVGNPDFQVDSQN